MTDMTDKKDLILDMLALHPSQGWYRQCLEAQLTADELATVEADPEFLRDVKSILFMAKQNLMAKRDKAIEVAASRGNWQGYDKMLQEVDREMFTVTKDIQLANTDDRPLEIVLKGKGNG